MSLAAQGTDDLTGLVGWVADVIEALGPVGVGMLVALENVFPPVPSEVVLPFAGFIAGRGEVGVWSMVGASTAGAVVGAIVLYEVGRRVGQERTRRFLCRLPLVEEAEVDRATDWFHRHGQGAVLTGRFIPLVRSLVSLPAGAERMGRVRFAALTAVGAGIWNTLWVWAGYLLGRQWKQVGRYSDWLNYALIAAAALVVLRFVWHRRDRLGSSS